MHTKLKLGPIGKGYVKEIRTKKGIRFIARWNAFVMDGDERKRIICGPHKLGRKVTHGPGLHSMAQAKSAWDTIRATIYLRHHPQVGFVSADKNDVTAKPIMVKTTLPKGTAAMAVNDFITMVYEPRRVGELEDNSRRNWEYYRDTFLKPFFGKYTIGEMNDDELIRTFMRHVADGEYGIYTARKAFTYAKALLALADNLGIIRGNACKVIPASQRIPKRIRQPTFQPFVSIGEFSALYDCMPTERDKIIIMMLYFCALRRSEWSAIRWSDIHQKDGFWYLRLDRSFCSVTHKVKEWDGKQGMGEGQIGQTVALPPQLATAIQSFRESVENNDPHSFIFATRNGKPIIPTNWSDDVLKPAGKLVGIPKLAFHWFRRGHATVQNQRAIGDKAIQGQLRHAKVETTRNIYMQVVARETSNAVGALEITVLDRMMDLQKDTKEEEEKKLVDLQKQEEKE